MCRNMLKIHLFCVILGWLCDMRPALADITPPPYLLQVRGGFSLLSNINGSRQFPQLNGPAPGGSVGASFLIRFAEKRGVAFYLTVADLWAHFDCLRPDPIITVEGHLGLRMDVDILEDWMVYVGGGGGGGFGQGLRPGEPGVFASGAVVAGIGYRFTDLFSLALEPIQLHIAGQNGQPTALYYGANLALGFAIR